MFENGGIIIILNEKHNHNKIVQWRTFINKTGDMRTKIDIFWPQIKNIFFTTQLISLSYSVVATLYLFILLFWLN